MTRVNRFIKATALLMACVWLIGSGARSAYAQDARQIYEKTCTMCHGPSGKGDGPAGKMLKPPPADLGTATKSASEADLIKIIKEGGKAVGRAPTMPAYGTKFSDEQIKGLAQLVKGFSSK